MANNCGYRICVNGDKEAAEELRNLLNSDEIGRVYSCSEFDETPNGFVADGSCNGSFYNGTDIWDANSDFRSAVEQLGLSIEVYGEEPSSFYEEHFVVNGNDLSVAEQTNAAYVISLDNMSPEEIAKEHEVSVDAVIGATDNDNVRFGGYEWEFNFESAHAERNDAVLHERFLRFLSDGCLNAGHGVFRIDNHEQLHDAGFTDAEFSEMSRFFSENDCPYKDTVTLLSSPLLACRPEIIDQFKQFGHPYFNEPAKRVAINERSILDCGETEIAEETHVAENDVICEVIDSNIQDNGAMYIAQVVGQEGLPFTGYELLSGGDTIDSLIEKVADFHSGVDWSVAEHGGTALGISVLCHAHPSGYDTNDTLINFRQLSDMDADELSNMKDSFDEMPDNRKQELLSSLFNDPEHIQWMGRTAEHIESRCETAREAVKEELTAGIDDFKELSEKGTPVSDKEFSRIFEGKDVDDTSYMLRIYGDPEAARELADWQVDGLGPDVKYEQLSDENGPYLVVTGHCDGMAHDFLNIEPGSGFIERANEAGLSVDCFAQSDDGWMEHIAMEGGQVTALDFGNYHINVGDITLCSDVGFLMNVHEIDPRIDMKKHVGNALVSKQNEVQKAVDALSGKLTDRHSPTLEEKVPEVEEAIKAF